MKLLRPMTVDAAALDSSSVAETEAAYNPATTYAINALVRYEDASGTTIYKSAANSNTGHAVTDPAWWTPQGASNRWKMFDGSVTSQTEDADEIEVVINCTGRVDSLALLNVNAATIRVVAEDAIDGVVFDTTFGMVSTAGVNDIFAYLTEPIERRADLLVTGIPPLYAGLTLTVTISSPGGTAKCGALVVSFSKDIGITLAGAQVGIKDYSLKTTNDFGDIVVTKRAYSKRANFTIKLDNAVIDQVQTLLAGYRAVPIVYVGADQLGVTIVYGYYRDFNIEIAGANYSICSIEIEGLT